MSLTLILTLLLLGGIGGFAAGLLGVGGGVLMFPILFYVPPLLGLESLDAKSVAAVVVSQVFFSALVGGSAHWRRGRVHGQLTLVAGAASVTGSFVGGVASKWASEWFLLLLFGVVSLLAGAMMFLPAPSIHREETPVEKVVVPLVPLSFFSCAIGIAVGFLGAANFVFIPLLIYILKVPTRIAIGSTLFIAMLNTASGFLGKLLTGQIPLLMALAVVIGACVGALGGERVHSRVSSRLLRGLFAGTVGVIALRIWITLLS